MYLGVIMGFDKMVAVDLGRFINYLKNFTQVVIFDFVCFW